MLTSDWDGPACSAHHTPTTHQCTINTAPLKPLLKQKSRGQTLKPNKKASDCQPLYQGKR